MAGSVLEHHPDPHDPIAAEHPARLGKVKESFLDARDQRFGNVGSRGLVLELERGVEV